MLAHARVFQYPCRTDNDGMPAFIIPPWSGGDDPNDLILELCRKNNIAWPQGEELVRRVQTGQFYPSWNRDDPRQPARDAKSMVGYPELTGPIIKLIDERSIFKEKPSNLCYY